MAKDFFSRITIITIYQLLSVCHTVLYLRAPRLFETLLQSQADGSDLNILTKLVKVESLILDDRFLTPLSDAERKDLLEIIKDRHHRALTVITGQCPTKKLASLHHTYRIELKGNSI